MTFLILISEGLRDVLVHPLIVCFHFSDHQIYPVLQIYKQ